MKWQLNIFSVCAKNEIYSECGANICQNTCGKPNNTATCTASCKAGCVCKNNYVRDQNGKCIPRDECPIGLYN